MTVDAHDAWRAYAGALHPDDAEHAAQAARRLHEADLARWVGVRDEHRAFTVAHVIEDAAARHDTGALDAYREHWVQATHTDPEAAPMLATLRERGLRLGILSSTPWPGAWHEEWLRRDGVLHLFDACGDGGRGGVQGEYKHSAATLPGRPTVIASSRTLCRSRPA